MRQLAFSLGLIWALAAGMVAALEIEDHARFGPEGAGRVLHVLSTTDTAVFAPVIEAFLQDNPGIAVDYTVASSAELAAALLAGEARFDLAISSAMDLQTKLANDGLVRRHVSAATAALPEWAIWNDMVFAFTQEPAAMVLSEAAFDGLPIPRSRQELIGLLRRNPERFHGKVGTYDIRQSGLGYLFATQDARASDTYWRLTEVMGALEARLYCCTAQMIDAVESGELAIAYNVLGSYARLREGSGRFVTILPADFTTLMLRSVIILRDAPSPALAGRFVDHVLVASMRPEGFGIGAPLAAGETGPNRIRLGPGLLVYLDRLKRRAFLGEWVNAIIQ